MKQIRILLSCFFFFLVTILAEKESKSQEVPCNLPEGFICGSTEGTVWEIDVIFPGHGALSIVPVPVYTSKKCCVESVPANACNAVSVGCTQVEPK